MRPIPQILIVVASALVVASSNSSAQSIAAPSIGLARLNLVSANPIGLPFEWYSGEFEHVLSSRTTAAVALSVGAASPSRSSSPYGENRYSILDGIVRYYRSGRALHDFSVGASFGFVRVRDNVCPDCAYNDSGSAPTIGIRSDYVWILGDKQHFSGAAGLGVRRVLGHGISEQTIPSGRLSVGYAW